MCKYSDDQWKCPYEALPDLEYCIFHLKDVGKDIKEFNKGIDEILKSEKKIINFNGFFFPPKTSDFSKTSHEHNHVFLIDVDFSYAEFSGDVNFIMAKFSRNAKFLGAEFSGNANFFGAEFLGDTEFTGTKFLGDTEFTGADLYRNVKFLGAKFLGDANFSMAKFLGDTEFIRAKFSGDTEFTGTKFLGDVQFFWTKFLGNANFFMAELYGDANFFMAELYGRFNFIPNNSKLINFKNTFFSENARILANLSQCNFNRSNIEVVDLTDSTWNNDEIKDSRLQSRIYNYFFNSSITIREASQEETAFEWKTLEGIYRRLKQSYQKSGNYEISGEFYIQEMECKRKQLGFLGRKFWNIFYRRFCLYGERPYNVILVSFITIIMFAISYLFCGIEFTGSKLLQIQPSYINYDLSLNYFGLQWLKANIHLVYNDFILCIYTSLITFTTLGYGDVHPIGWSRLFASIESAIGIFVTALFIFVFTRRMIR
ncbi:pentapeptide repeat-containing protein [Methanococcoides alaskense]|uniref:Uncharacterized protein YjbI with pentapeptide repeats n=1 Tax=Methanococcoides alaskense TaxID=325778 RepID=A0AA90Z6S8_9EURY|nr:pentapeptide repeat-containing protein [Methanococcoides alaskense]MDA0525005.1 pentapeptide repeat-containing protein [Methanococcoides alaskense]MDR6222079.1 uncharacterized protein YjbI with pentapeptide repeats [Methanococcoides alaskense]